MAARPLASVKLSFGLVTVPVHIYTSSESSSRVSFNWLHKECGGRLKQQMYCPTDNRVVQAEDRVKGYEFRKGEYVKFTTDELKVMEAKSNQTIEIVEFVPDGKVERIYLDKLYYLGPDKGGDKPYHLLTAALRKTKRVAIAKYAARGKMYLVMIRPVEKGLSMEQLHYEDEIKHIDEVPMGKGEVKKQELDLACKIIDQGTVKQFTPSKYEDEVKLRILQAVDKKVEGQDITKIFQTPERKIVDLMDALKESLEKKSEKNKKKKKKKKIA